MKKIQFILIALAGFYALTFTACEEEGCTDPLAVNYDAEAKEGGECTYPNLTMMLHQKVGDQDLTTGSTYTINGYPVKVTLSQFYLSGFMYMDDSGDGYAAEKDGEPVYLLATPETQMYDLGTMKTGDLHMLNFNVGVDSVTNSQDEIDFAAWPADHPLSAQTPSMVWNWNTGYIFLKFEGRIDLDSDGTFDEDLVYHIGLNKFLMDVSLTAHTDITDASEQIMVSYDVAKVLEGIDFSVEGNWDTHTMNNMPLATQIAANVETAFSMGH
jgi:hypothetical protein